MIVDLLRNDLSRIAEPFSVQVPALFHTEALPTVWQMTSDVQARTRAGTTLADVFAALFPCGSVTGAPKVRAMQMIRALEPQPRGVYCGAIGVVRPGAPGQGIRATFNVPIRTVTVQAGALRCGIGSGITSGAEPDAEWQEWRNKRQFLERASSLSSCSKPWRWRAASCATPPSTWQRLASAAAHFGYPWDAGTTSSAACRRWRKPTRKACGACACCWMRQGRATRRSLCHGRVTRPGAAATGRPPADGGPRRIRALQDHPPRPLRRLHADRSPACSTPCCGTPRARSPNARAATWRC